MGITKGSCHCGSIQFEVATPILMFAKCNCSLCSRKNAEILVIEPEQFTLISGQDRLGLYRWNTMKAQHYFCTNCGIYTHHIRRRDDKMGVNRSCLPDLPDSEIPELQHVDGASQSLVTNL